MYIYTYRENKKHHGNKKNIQTFRIYLDPSLVIKNKCLEINVNEKVHVEITT